MSAFLGGRLSAPSALDVLALEAYVGVRGECAVDYNNEKIRAHLPEAPVRT